MEGLDTERINNERLSAFGIKRAVIADKSRIAFFYFDSFKAVAAVDETVGKSGYGLGNPKTLKTLAASENASVDALDVLGNIDAFRRFAVFESTVVYEFAADYFESIGKNEFLDLGATHKRTAAEGLDRGRNVDRFERTAAAESIVTDFFETFVKNNFLYFPIVLEGSFHYKFGLFVRFEFSLFACRRENDKSGIILGIQSSVVNRIVFVFGIYGYFLKRAEIEESVAVEYVFRAVSSV